MKSLRQMTQLILPLLLVMPQAFAGDYLGFALGQDAFEAVIKKLKLRK